MSTTTITDKFVRSDDFAARIDSVCLPDEAWAVFALLEHPASAEELSPQLEQPVDAVIESINALLEHGLVRKKLRNWREFLAQKGDAKVPGGSAPVTAPVVQALAAGRPGAALAGWPKPSAPTIATGEPPATIAPFEIPATPSVPAPAEPAAMIAEPAPAPTLEPAAPEPPPLFSDFTLPRASEPIVAEVAPIPAPAATPAIRVTPAPAVPRAEPAAVTMMTPAAAAPATPRAAPETVLPVSFSIVNEKARLERRATSAMTISFRICAQVATAAVTSWKLNPLLKAIGQKAGGGLPGQLLVYRVFIHVPAEMMHAAGIQSLSLVDDSVMIRDRAFYDALCQAAHAVAGVDLRAIKA